MLLQSTRFETFTHVDKLEHLSMRKNSGSADNVVSRNICRLCGFLRNVTVLDLSENNMKRVPPFCFQRCSNLEILYLESNKISEVGNASFAGLKH